MPGATSPSPSRPRPLPPQERRWVMLGVGMGVLMATIDMSIVNLALPSLMDSLHAGFALIQWVPLGYTLVLTSLMLTAARLGDLQGVKKPYLCGVALFTVASLLCGLAADAPWLVAARALQGLGAAFMQALGVASGLLSLSRTLGHTSGIPLMGAVFSAQALAAILALGTVGLAALAWRWDKASAKRKTTAP